MILGEHTAIEAKARKNLSLNDIKSLRMPGRGEDTETISLRQHGASQKKNGADICTFCPIRSFWVFYRPKRLLEVVMRKRLMATAIVKNMI